MLIDHKDVADRHPYNELTKAVARSLHDDVLDPEERADFHDAVLDASPLHEPLNRPAAVTISESFEQLL